MCLGLLTLFSLCILRLLRADTFAAQCVPKRAEPGPVFSQLSAPNGDIRCVLCVILKSYLMKIKLSICIPKPNQTSLDTDSFKDFKRHLKMGRSVLSDVLPCCETWIFDLYLFPSSFLCFPSHELYKQQIFVVPIFHLSLNNRTV